MRWETLTPAWRAGAPVSARGPRAPARTGPPEPLDLAAELPRPLPVGVAARPAAGRAQPRHLGRRARELSAGPEETQRPHQWHELLDARHEGGPRVGIGRGALAVLLEGPAEVKQHAERLRRVEVVVHRRLEPP